jgi:cytochrome P450
MSLYRHVKDRADLIEAMVHASGPSVEVAAVNESDQPWTDQLRAAAIAMYEVAHGEREIVHAALRQGVVASWEPILAEQVARILVRGGATPKEAVSFARYATTVMMSLVLAEIWGRIPEDDTWAEHRAAYGAMTATLSDDRAVLREAGVDAFPTSRRAFVEEFADFVVAGARATLESSSTAARPRRRRSP